MTMCIKPASKKATYTGGVACGSSGCGGCNIADVNPGSVKLYPREGPLSVESYPREGSYLLEDNSCSDVTADSVSGADCCIDISYSAADVGRSAADVGRVAIDGLEATADRGAVFLRVPRLERTKLLFCRRRVLARHFLNVRSRFASSSSATPKNLATLCFTDLKAQFTDLQTLCFTDLKTQFSLTYKHCVSLTYKNSSLTYKHSFIDLKAQSLLTYKHSFIDLER